MTVKKTSWLQAYQDVVSNWGDEPDWRLMEYARFVPEGPILDLGLGEGRNALYFAKLGYTVEGVDESKTYVKRCRERAKAKDLDLTVEEADLRSIEIPQRRYALIIASKVLQMFLKSESTAITEKMYPGLMRRGLIYVRTFSVERIAQSEAIRALEEVEPNTFYSPQRKRYYHYFTRDEILSLFPKMRVLYCVEGVELDRFRSKTSKKPQTPAIIEFIGQRMR
ncbi:MAG: class I SAM-dependent methyltransferase [Candidatus Odinarchaeota archaeon]